MNIGFTPAVAELYAHLENMENVVAAVAALGLISLFFFFFKFQYLFHDFMYILKLHRVRSKWLRLRKQEPIYTVLDCFLENVHKNFYKPFLIFEEEVYTFLQVDRYSNRVAWALREHGGLREGDTVAMLVGNEPNFVFLWLGLMKLGCTASLLNTNIRGKSLMHCFNCCSPTVLIAGGEYLDAVCEVLPELRERSVSVLMLGDSCDVNGIVSLKEKIEESDDAPVSRTLRANVTMKSPVLYIFTSGTTGLPKAGIFSQERLWRSALYQHMIGVNHDDVIYISLPLYHIAGLGIGIGGAIERGMTVVLKRKFSASQFWNDCRKHNVTVIQYIGEIMRYLCNTPPQDIDRQHRVRLAFGNGLRGDIWQEFQRRFGLVKITEFYSASDGNVFMTNYMRTVGAVGRMNMFHKRMMPFTLVEYDAETGVPIRDSRGRCIPVATGETGLLISEITETTPFYGYVGNPAQTEKKKLYGVFEDGDVYLNSGDLLKIDHNGFVYFQDRVGDTFRWKGENVATSEVADILSMLDFIENVCVYGVEVPGHEGRIGMTAMMLKENQEFDCQQTFIHVMNFLPAYARPRFIRILKTLELTGTFKLIKMSLVKDGFDPNKVTPPIYVLQESSKNYVPLTPTYYNDIISGKLRF